MDKHNLRQCAAHLPIASAAFSLPKAFDTLLTAAMAQGVATGASSESTLRISS
jgi:hypothetical protein